MPPVSAKFIWCPEQDPQTGFTLFSRSFELTDDRLEKFDLHVFADSRYRLWVNGTVIGYGPARFHVSHPEYDSYDLAPVLLPGGNRMVVEVWDVKESSVQMDPNPGGFIAWGGGAGVDLATPGGWLCLRSEARSATAPLYSFAIPRTEILDMEKWEQELCGEGWAPATIMADPVWGALAPRSVPMLPFNVVALKTGKAGALADDELICGFHYRFDPPVNGDKKWISVACTLDSPVEQTVEISLFWGRNYLDGKPLTMVRERNYGNRESVCVRLDRGVHVLYSEVEGISESWGYQVGIPRRAHVDVRALPGGKERLLVSAQMTAEECPSVRGMIPATLDDLRQADYLTPFAGGLHTQFPARENGWAMPLAPLEEVDLLHGFSFPLSSTGKAAVVVDFNTVYTGHPCIEVECSADAVIDVSYSERLRPCGLSDSYRCHHLVNSTDRYLVKPGRNMIEVFPERGGRYLQITAASKGTVRLMQAGFRLTTQSPDLVEPLREAPENYKKIMALCRRTLLAGYAECFTDSPWREQGMYLGDHYVQYLAMRTLQADEKVIERCLHLFADCRLPNGQLPPVCPGHNHDPLSDFTLIWILMLEEWATRSGNLSGLEKLWPEVEKIFAADGFLRRGPLVGGSKIFICWGILPPARGKGGISAALSAFYAGALAAAARMARLLGKDDRATAFEAERAELQDAFMQTFWSNRLGAIAPVPEGIEGRDLYSCHVNILALLYNLVPAERREALLDRIETDLRNQLIDPSRAKLSDGHVEYYFLFYTFRLLAREGRHALIEEMIRVLYGLMTDFEEPTLWENYCTGLRGLESQCHGWSSAPLIYFSEELLGVKHPDPLHPERITIRPASATLTSCSGVYPHAKGNIEIAWKVNGRAFHLAVSAPDGVEIAAAGPGLPFMHLDSHVELRSSNRSMPRAVNEIASFRF